MPSCTHPLEHQVLFREGDYTAEMCLAPTSLETAYRLRYDAYVAAAAIPENADRRFVDRYDGQDNARTYLLWHTGRPVASVRSLTWSSAYDWAPTPSVEYFRAEVAEHLGLRTPLLESNKYVVAPDFQGRQSLTAQLLLFRIQLLGLLADGCTYVITAVRPRHVRFYERFMDFFAISEAIEVPDVQFPIQLLATTVEGREKLQQKSPVTVFREADLDRYHRCLERAPGRTQNPSL
jgi:hypothetical protein